MIKFFRRIRQQMLDQNKTSRYFKYALGEIILVVFGILIALQINTWNENRKAANEETKILKALQADFKVSKNRIKETIVIQQKALNHGKTLIQIHERKDLKEFDFFNTQLDSLDNLIGFGTSWFRTEPVTGAYKALISAGKVDLIKNEKLRHLLAQFAADLESGFEDQESAMFLLNNLNNKVSDFVLKIASNKYRERLQLNSRKTDTLFIAEKFFKNESFFGDLYNKLALEYNRLARQQSMLSQTQAILVTIELELTQE
tara:strand:+ start:2404 stop:3180 length:777 start_codon:yes stop_codon:yes gene_type:complete